MAGPAIRSAALQSERVERYGTVEMRLDLQASYDNPYDPAQVDVHATFRSPSGAERQVAGFYYLDYRMPTDGSAWPVRTERPGEWRIRFTPDEVGEWSYRVVVRDASGQTATAEGTLTVVPSSRPGFVRRPVGALYLAYEDGRPFFGIGHNLAWWQQRPDDYDRWLAEMAASGANLIRIWMASWSFAVEWRETGLGNYDRRQDRAYLLDYVMDRAEQLGIHVILVLNHHGQFSARVNPQWVENPYNQANGGMLTRPADFFTAPAARSLFKRRLRYIVARWAHHPNLLAWELWNEVDLTDEYDPESVARWHEEMAAYLREIDPYRHLVTTSFSDPQREDAVWRLPGIDFTTTHFYGAADMAEAIMANDRRKIERYGKPTLTAEYGTDWQGPSPSDPEGVNVHNAAWAGLFSGASATGMSWWWESYLHPFRLYRHYQGLAQFVPLDRWLPARPYPVSVESARWGDLTISPTLGWGATPETPHWVVGPEGVRGPSAVASFLYGAVYNTQLRSEPSRFDVTLPHDSSLGVRVLVAARSGATLQIRVDGVPVRTVQYPPHPEDRRVDELVSVALPAGTHRIEVENVGTDWIQIGGYVLAGAVPRVRAYALQGPQGYLIWLQDRQHTWSQVAQGYEPALMEGVVVALEGVAAGRYHVRVWDPWAMQAVEEREVESRDGTLRLHVPAFRRDVAVSVQRP